MMTIDKAMADKTPVGLPLRSDLLGDMQALGAKFAEGSRDDLHYYAIEWRGKLYGDAIAQDEKIAWKNVQAWAIDCTWHRLKTNAGIHAGRPPTFG